MTDAAGEFIEACSAAARGGTLAALTLSKPVGDAARTTARPVEVGGRPAVQLARREGPREVHENLTPEDFAAWLAAAVPARFRHAHAFTADADLSLLVNKKGRASLQRKRPTKTPAAAPHDRAKPRLIPEGVPCPFLEAAGVMTPEGRVRAAKRPKFRQINRFLELVDDVYPELPAEGTLRVAEFGSGKSHLTFALHHLLHSLRGREVEILSVDRNESVVRDAAATAERLGMTGVRHVAGEIADVGVPAGTHLALWLHACDTATDDALAASVRAGVPVVLAVPCCQHELNRLIASDSPLFADGLVRERAAALATDALRAAALRRLGYATQVAEFIDLEHTAKNVLIRAVKRDGATDRGAYARLKADLGLDSWHLQRRLPELAAGPPGRP